ncbi:electron transfer flavoprotein subunit beta [Selenomonas sp. TAMA-11512]|uniref:electron transfer flavoprotein subunit beta/FixA family protein n=1 Tax=Selenomonas sp. TAMA-11512 TaxID=3095337 RepID=UPI0030930EB6|nr:electron transfer flavoprotein subunit beta [Selenomonas sp. TAMA-11512]
MKIAVCIKHVPVETDVEVDPKTHSIQRADATCDIDPCNMNAMELAASLKKKDEDTRIDVFTMGPDAAASSLKKCLAVGADEAYLLSDRRFAGGDTLGTARVLASFLQRVDAYDVVITGAESSDGATGQVGPMLAELLGIADVADATSAEPDPTDTGTLLVGQKVPEGTLSLRIKLPVLLTIPFGCNEPALPTLRAQMKANRREIRKLTADDLDASVLAKLTAKSVVTDVAPNPAGKEAKELTGTPAEIAEQIESLIAERRKNNV